MKLKLSAKEKNQLLVTALQYFGESLRVWEHQVDYENTDYINAKIKMIKNTESLICVEDIYAYMILKGKGIKIVDCEDEENIVLFDFRKFNQNISKCDYSDIMKLLDDNGDYDFYNTDAVLQCLIFGEVTYG